MKRMITTVEELMVPAGTVHITLPLLISLLEYVRTEPMLTSTDVMMISERIANKSRGSVLTVEDYADIIGLDSAPAVENDTVLGNVWCDDPGNVVPLTSHMTGNVKPA